MSAVGQAHLLDQDEFDEEMNYAVINAERGQMAAEKGEWISCQCRLEEALLNLARARVCLAERLRVVNQYLDSLNLSDEASQ